MMSYNAYQISEARRQYMLEGDNRERLADIARAGKAHSNAIVRVLNAFQHLVGAKHGSPSLDLPRASEVIQPIVNG